MVQYISCLILIRIVLPLCFLSCAIFRYNGLSLLYLILFIIVPYVEIPVEKTMKGKTGKFLLLVMFLSILMFVLQMTVQILLYRSSLNRNSILGKLLHEIGLIPVNNMAPKEKTRLLCPEISMFFSSVFVYFACRKLTTKKNKLPKPSLISCRRYYSFFWYCVLLSTLCTCGIILPSVLNIVYFLTFICGMTLWACHKGKYVTSWCFKLISIFTALHIIVLYIIQMRDVQNYMVQYSNLQRYLGLSILVNQTSSELHTVEAKCTKFLNAFILLWLNYVLGILKHSYSQQVPIVDILPKPEDRQDEASKISPSRYSDQSSLELLQDVMKMQKENGDSEIIQKLLSVDTFKELTRQLPGEKEKKLFSWWDLWMDTVFIMKEMLFLWTHIIMMMWSVQYHSWLGFIWLLMVCFLWFLPHPKRLTLLCSPIILGFAIVLLLIKYIYSMELNEFERPESATLKVIGFTSHYDQWPKHLFIQSLYTVVFWITVHERKLQIKGSTDRHIETFMTEHQEMFYRSFVMMKFMTNVKRWLIKFWIWVVVTIISIYSFHLSDKYSNLALVQLIYMFLVLLFVFILQVSYNFWRKLLKTFWIIFILCSEIVLVFEYIHAFGFAHRFLEQYGHISVPMQMELGLCICDTKKLFRKLWIPTILMIIVGIQLHYFHKELMSLTKIKRGAQLNLKVEVPMEHMSNPDLVTSQWEQKINYVVDKIWLFLELHGSKVLLLYLFILCVVNVCAMHMIILLVMLHFLLFRRSLLKSMVPMITGLASIMILLLNIYQLNFFDHEKYNVTCSKNYTTKNTAEWVGFRKISSEDLYQPMVLYLIIIIIATLMTIVNIRQKYVHYLVSNEPFATKKVMFPEVERKDADTNLKNCFKFMLNYGFYKFGAEICLIMVMILVVNLMDAFALCHVLWLWILTFHQQSRKWWTAFQCFITLLIIINYVLLIDVTYILCLDYPWNGNSKLKLLQQWLYLPGRYHYLGVRALIYNSLLLIAVYRKNVGFWIEKNYGGLYPGGTNEDITNDLEQPDYVNPVHDHTSIMDSWLDPLKDYTVKILIVTLMSLFFIAGLLRLNFFSPAYLAVSFLLFWQGYKVYLYPLRKIQQYWNILLIFTLFIITFKNICQVIALLQIEKINNRLCPVVQMFHIAYIGEEDQVNGSCYVPRDSENIMWDSICYMVLIIMKRFSRSCYVIHHVTDSKAQLCLASRGLQLMQELSHKKEKRRQMEVKNILEKVRTNLELAKRKWKDKYREVETHNGIIRTADYFLFEDALSEETKVKETKDEEEHKEERITLAEFFETMFVSGIEHAAYMSSNTVQVSELSIKEKIEVIDKKRQKKENKSAGQYIKLWLLVLWGLIVCCIESLISYLGTVSQDYHYIRVTMSREHRMLKKVHNFKDQGGRQHSSGQWMPNREEMIANRIWLDAVITAKGDSNSYLDFGGRAGKISMKNQYTLIRLVMSLWNVLMSSSEHICYFVILMYHLQSSSLLALPLSFMVLLWGALTKPRPTATFWTILITYTVLSIVVKWLYHFDFMPWNQMEHAGIGGYQPRISVFKRQRRDVLDLILLCTLFFHRHMTRSLGLWNQKNIIVSHKERAFIMDSSGVHPITAPVDLKFRSADTSLVHKSTPQSRLITLETEKEDISENMKVFLKLIFKEYSKSIGSFFHDLVHTSSHSLKDIYSWMFFCDFCVFLIYIFAFESFGQDVGATNITRYLEVNYIPVKFVMMLMIQFGLMFLDRMLYLRKKMLARIIFYYALVICWHIWMFFILPSITEQTIKELIPRQICHLIKCCYFLLSAYQIRNGYPTSISGNFLCKNYSMLNKICHQAYLQFPFLYELRTLTDWLWTDTSLTFYEWLKMEDIFANVFQRKCSQDFEIKYSKRRHKKTKIIIKYSIVGGLVFFIILTIWFPLCIYAFMGVSGSAAIPHRMSVSVMIGSHPVVYFSVADTNNIHQLNERQWSLIKRVYQENMAAVAFLDGYHNTDVALVKYPQSSGARWIISQPAKQKFIENLKSNSSLEVKLMIIVIRQRMQFKSLMQVFYTTTYKLTRKDRILILMMLKSQRVTLTLPCILPKFLRITSFGTIEVLRLFMGERIHRNLTLRYRGVPGQEWWEMKEECDDNTFKWRIKYWNPQCEGFTIVTFNDGILSKILLTISGSGIISLYLGFVYICFRVFRFVYGNLLKKIIYTDMPYVDRILQLCLEIYLARENQDFTLEEELFAKLLFLYRSPETIIKYTRYPEEWLTGEQELQHRP